MNTAMVLSIIFLVVAVGLTLADANPLAIVMITVISTIWAAAAHVLKELK